MNPTIMRLPRGGLTTKIHALTDQRDSGADPLDCRPGRRHPQLLPLLDDYRHASTEYALSTSAYSRRQGLLTPGRPCRITV